MSSLNKRHCPQQRSERSREACRFVLQNGGAEHRCLQHMAIDQQPDHCRSPATPAAAVRRLSGRAAGVVACRHEGGADRCGCAKDHPRANHLVRTACRGVAAQVFPRPLANPRAGPDVTSGQLWVNLDRVQPAARRAMSAIPRSRPIFPVPPISQRAKGGHRPSFGLKFIYSTNGIDIAMSEISQL
jgi:hypothetical protein